MRPTISAHKITNLAPVKTLALAGTSPRTLTWDAEERLYETVRVVLTTASDLSFTLNIVNHVEGSFGTLIIQQDVAGAEVLVTLPGNAKGPVSGTISILGEINSRHILKYTYLNGFFYFERPNEAIKVPLVLKGTGTTGVKVFRVTDSNGVDSFSADDAGRSFTRTSAYAQVNVTNHLQANNSSGPIKVGNWFDKDLLDGMEMAFVKSANYRNTIHEFKSLDSSAYTGIVARSATITGHTAVERDAIASPTAGLLTYVNDQKKFQYFDGAGWKDVGFTQSQGDNMYLKLTGGVLEQNPHVPGKPTLDVRGILKLQMKSGDEGNHSYPGTFLKIGTGYEFYGDLPTGGGQDIYITGGNAGPTTETMGDFLYSPLIFGTKTNKIVEITNTIVKINKQLTLSSGIHLDSSAYHRSYNSGISVGWQYPGGGYGWSFTIRDWVQSVDVLRATGTNNVLIGTITGNGSAKLEVKGTGATNATKTLRLLNSANTEIFNIRDDSTIYVKGITAASRDSLTGVLGGSLSYISDQAKFQYFDGTSWKDIGFTQSQGDNMYLKLTGGVLSNSTDTGVILQVKNSLATATGNLQEWIKGTATVASISSAGKGSFKGGLDITGTGTAWMSKSVVIRDVNGVEKLAFHDNGNLEFVGGMVMGGTTIQGVTSFMDTMNQGFFDLSRNWYGTTDITGIRTHHIRSAGTMQFRNTTNTAYQGIESSTSRLAGHTTAQRDAIVSPADGLQIYNTSYKKYEWFDSASMTWKTVSDGELPTTGNFQFRRIAMGLDGNGKMRYRPELHFIDDAGSDVQIYGSTHGTRFQFGSGFDFRSGGSYHPYLFRFGNTVKVRIDDAFKLYGFTSTNGKGFTHHNSNNTEVFTVYDNSNVYFKGISTTTRDGLTGVLAGTLAYNETINRFQYFNGTAWDEVGKSQAELDSRYLLLTGGELSGDLTFKTGSTRRIVLNESIIRDNNIGELLLSNNAVGGGKIYLRPSGDTSNINELYLSTTEFKLGGASGKTIWHEGNLSKSEFATAGHTHSQLHNQNTDGGTTSNLFGLALNNTLESGVGYGIYFGGSDPTGNPYMRLVKTSPSKALFTFYDTWGTTPIYADVRGNTFYNAAGTEVSYVGHHHDDKYSLLTHNHDDKYSLLAHHHDDVYLKLTGGTLSGALTGTQFKLGAVDQRLQFHGVGEYISSNAAYAINFHQSNTLALQLTSSTAAFNNKVTALDFNVPVTGGKFSFGGGEYIGGISGYHIGIYTNNGTERVRFHNNGRVSVGTTTGNAKFTIKGEGSTSSTTAFEIINSNNQTTFKVTDDGAMTLSGKPVLLEEPKAVTSTGSGADANFWTKIATVNMGSSQNVDASLQIAVTGSNSAYNNVVVGLHFKQNTSGSPTPVIAAQIMSSSSSVASLNDDCIKITYAGFGSAFDVHFKKDVSLGQYSIYELSKSLSAGVTVTYLSTQGWVSAEPTATHAVKSDGLRYNTHRVWHDGTTLDATKINAGTLDVARLSNRVVLRDVNNTLTGALTLSAATINSVALYTRVSGEQNERYRINGDGQHKWINPSTGSLVLNLYNSSGVLTTDYPINAIGGLRENGTPISTIYEQISNKGAINGYASLDNTGKVPITQLPDSVLGQVEYKGTYNAETNTPTLSATPSEKGHYYVVNVRGTRFGLDFNVGDWIISDGSKWDKVDNTDAVTSVFGRIGAVVGADEDYNASQIVFTPYNTITATRVQGAISHLEDSKSNVGHTHTFESLVSKPTTVAGFGITDAMTTAHPANAVTSPKITNWDAAYTHSTSAHLALGETASTAYRGDRGKIAYDYSVIGHLPLTGGTITGNLTLSSGAARQVNINQTIIRDNNSGATIISQNGASAAIHLRPGGDGSSTNQLYLTTTLFTIGGNAIWHAGNFTNLNQLTTRNFSDLQNKPTTIAGYGITDAANLVHSHKGEDITSGIINDARLSSNIPLKNAANTFTGTNVFDGLTTVKDLTVGGFLRSAMVTSLDTNLLLLADKRYTVTATLNGVSTNVAKMFDNFPNGSFNITNPDPLVHFPFVVEITGMPTQATSYLTFFINSWRDLTSGDYGTLKSWKLEVLSYDSGTSGPQTWTTVLNRTNASNGFPLTASLWENDGVNGNSGRSYAFITGIRFTVYEAVGNASNILYFTEMGIRYTGGGAPHEGVGALSIGGGTLFGNLSINGNNTVTGSQTVTLASTFSEKLTIGSSNSDPGILINTTVGNTTDLIADYKAGNIRRLSLNRLGTQAWYLNTGSAEAGSIVNTTVSGRLGIVFANNAGLEKTHIVHRSGGGLDFAGHTGSGSPVTTMSLTGDGNLIVTGTLSASGYNKANWDAAYNWGNHGGVGYLTSLVLTLGGDLTGNVTINGNATLNATIPKPAAATNLVLSEASGVVTVQFNQSVTSGVDTYEVWRSTTSTSTGFSKIAEVKTDDIIATMTVPDNKYAKKGLVYYTVYAVKRGIRSNALNGGITTTGNAPNVTNLVVNETVEGFIITYDIPNDSRVSGVTIKVHAHDNAGSISESSSVQCYTGLSSYFFYKIPDLDLDKFHQFWIYTNTIM
jgi:hypothetical protein